MEDAVPGSDSRVSRTSLGIEVVERIPATVDVVYGPPRPFPSQVPHWEIPLVCRLRQPDWRAPVAAIPA